MIEFLKKKDFSRSLKGTLFGLFIVALAFVSVAVFYSSLEPHSHGVEVNQVPPM